jgi:alkaline phosphatase D
MSLHRRQFLQAISVSAMAPLVLSSGVYSTGCNPIPATPIPQLLDSVLPLGLDDDTPEATRRTFDCSVASGDPSVDGVIIWTRISTLEYVADEQLLFQVAADSAFSNVIVEGFVAAADINAERDYTVNIDLGGQLQAFTSYFYRFVYKATSSRTGRCKTAPAAEQSLAQLKFGVLTCQDFTNGYYGALNYLAADDSVDYVLHLGDFIYESVGDPRFQNANFPDRKIVLPSGSNVIMDIVDYRHVYKTYRSDRNLQLAMERHTWIITADDHETANDCYWDYARDTLGAPDHPYTTNAQYGNDPALLKQLKLDSQRAWLEYIPARVIVDAGADHPHDFSRIYRHVQLGNFADLFMLDTRSYRSAHPCGEGQIGQRYAADNRECDILDAGQTLLGQMQREWLLDGLVGSTATWKLLGNQTFMGRLAITNPQGDGLYVDVDAWDGYGNERKLLLLQLQQSGVNNLVVLTGDLHTYIASHVKIDYNNKSNDDETNVIGVEFMTPSVTSSGLIDEVLSQFPFIKKTDALTAFTDKTIKATNPHIRFFNSVDHGYSTLTLTDEYAEWAAFSINKNTNVTNNERWQVAKYRKTIGVTQLQMI